jgi:DedD protein
LDSTLKQRLLGAVVLIALAVVFVPMLLDGPVQRSRVDLAVPLPPPPQIAPTRTVPPPDLLEQPSPGAALAELPEPLDAPGGTASPPPSANASADPPVPAPVAEPEAPEVSTPPPENTPAEDAPPAPEPEPAPTAPEDPELAVWAVQVGAFGREENAMALREQLRAAGLPAYVDRVPGNEGVLHRVRLGPVANRAEAETLAERAQEQSGLDGIIVSR